MTNNTTGLLGVALTDTPTSSDLGIALGTTIMDGDIEYMFVQAGTAITAKTTVAINSSFVAFPATTTNVRAGGTPAFPQIAFAASDYGWVPLRGRGLQVKLRNGCLPAVVLYTSAVAGLLDDGATTTFAKLNGVVALGTAAASGTAISIIANYPSRG
jgi:hypothetical protein